ncbi:MAG: hypothetical protein O2905_04715 [Proteobacteria bacterium]|nr:hypothetical protein [Pseudomonadota bacterium]
MNEILFFGFLVLALGAAAIAGFFVVLALGVFMGQRRKRRAEADSKAGEE